MAKTPAQAVADAQSTNGHKVVVPTTSPPPPVVELQRRPTRREVWHMLTGKDTKPILGASPPPKVAQVSTFVQGTQWTSEKLHDLAASTRDNGWTQLKLGVLTTGAVAVGGGRAASGADYHVRGTSLQILGVFLPMMGWVGLNQAEAKTNYMYEYAGNLTETPEAQNVMGALANAASTTANNTADTLRALVAVQEQVKNAYTFAKVTFVHHLPMDGDSAWNNTADIIEQIRQRLMSLYQNVTLPSLPSLPNVTLPSAKDLADATGLTEAAKVPGRVGKDITKVADAVATAIGGGTSAAGGAAGSVSAAASSIANDVSTATRVVIIIAGVYIVYRVVR